MDGMIERPAAFADLTGRVAFVTGASSGLGERFARVLASCGAKVAVAARRKDRLDALVAQITAAGGTAFAIALDMGDDAALDQMIRNRSDTVYHPVGTARMGSDADAVCDPQLRVRGVQGLYIADASVMPRLVSGNTNAPAMMIGERCARFITGRDRKTAAA